MEDNCARTVHFDPVSKEGSSFHKGFKVFLLKFIFAVSVVVDVVRLGLKTILVVLTSFLIQFISVFSPLFVHEYK